MSSARSRKFRNDFKDRLDRARAAKNPNLAEKQELPIFQYDSPRVSGAIGSWKGFATEEAKQDHMQGMMRFFNRRPQQQPVVRQWHVDPPIFFMGANNFNLGGDEVWNYEVPRQRRNDDDVRWEVNFTPDPTVRFETPVAPKEPDICDIINLDD